MKKLRVWFRLTFVEAEKKLRISAKGEFLMRLDCFKEDSDDEEELEEEMVTWIVYCFFQHMS